MDTQLPPKKSEKEKLNEDFLKIAFPDWMRSSKKSHDFRRFVIDKHIVLENLLDLLITAYFFDTVSSKKSEAFKNGCLAYMDFSKKVKVLKKLDLIDEKIRGGIYKINDYRLAQVHIKKGDPLRDPKRKNWENFQKISTEIHSKLAAKIMLTDSELKKRIEKIVKQKSLSKT